MDIRRQLERALGVQRDPPKLLRWLPRRWTRDGFVYAQHLREGRMQRGLSLVAGLSCLLGGLEVSYEHYRGSYGQRVMYTPPLLSALGFGACLWGVKSPRAARTIMPVACALLLADGAIGFCFHVRGVARKPGGWRVPVFNVIMGPPLFAPLLLGVGGYLGVVAAFMRREDDPRDRHLPLFARPRRGFSHELREGRFQKHMAAATALASLLSGLEALYSHYKNNFRYRAQYTPLVTAPLLTAASLGGIASPTVAETALPVASLLALANGAVGFFYHARGVARRPGGLGRVAYNILYGPPIFAPLLFSASGFLGLLATVMRREKAR